MRIIIKWFIIILCGLLLLNLYGLFSFSTGFASIDSNVSTLDVLTMRDLKIINLPFFSEDFAVITFQDGRSIFGTIGSLEDRDILVTSFYILTLKSPTYIGPIYFYIYFVFALIVLFFPKRKNKTEVKTQNVSIPNVESNEENNEKNEIGKSDYNQTTYESAEENCNNNNDNLKEEKSKKWHINKKNIAIVALLAIFLISIFSFTFYLGNNNNSNNTNNFTSNNTTSDNMINSKIFGSETSGLSSFDGINFNNEYAIYKLYYDAERMINTGGYKVFTIDSNVEEIYIYNIGISKYINLYFNISTRTKPLLLHFNNFMVNSPGGFLIYKGTSSFAMIVEYESGFEVNCLKTTSNISTRSYVFDLGILVSLQIKELKYGSFYVHSANGVDGNNGTDGSNPSTSEDNIDGTNGTNASGAYSLIFAKSLTIDHTTSSTFTLKGGNGGNGGNAGKAGWYLGILGIGSHEGKDGIPGKGGFGGKCVVLQNDYLDINGKSVSLKSDGSFTASGFSIYSGNDGRDGIVNY